MIEIEAEVDVDEREILEMAAESYQQQIEEGGIDCPTEGCDGNMVDAELWVTSQNHVDGEVLCKNCNTRVELDIDDSELQDAVNEIEETLSNMF